MIERVRNRLHKLLEAPRKPLESLPFSLFIHIPKCGGSSVVAAIKQAYLGHSLTSFNYPAAFRAAQSISQAANKDSWGEEWLKYRTYTLLFYLGCQYRLVYGHMPFSKEVLSQFGSQYKFITVFRDPMERFISNYIYDRTGPFAQIEDNLSKSPKDEILEYLDSKHAWWTAQTQVFMIAGLNNELRYDPDEAVPRAIGHIKHFSVIGFCEQLDDFSRQTNQLLNTKINIGHINKTTDWVSKSDDRKKMIQDNIDDEVRERIRNLCQHEYKVYNAAKKIDTTFSAPIAKKNVIEPS